MNHTDRRFWTRHANGSSIDDKQLEAIEQAFQADLEWIGPVYRLPNQDGREGMICPLPDVLLVRLRPTRGAAADGGPDAAAALTLARTTGARQPQLSEDAQRSKLLVPWRWFRVGDPRATPCRRGHCATSC